MFSVIMIHSLAAINLIASTVLVNDVVTGSANKAKIPVCIYIYNLPIATEMHNTSKSMIASKVNFSTCHNT